jgi:hypothetical protein
MAKSRLEGDREEGKSWLKAFQEAASPTTNEDRSSPAADDPDNHPVPPDGSREGCAE